MAQTTTRTAKAAEAAAASDRRDVGADRLTAEQRVALGKRARAAVPLEAHGEFRPAESRDPVALLLDQDKTRVPDWCPFDMVGCWCRRSPSIGARRW